jgi:hypothetical protein
MNRSPIAVVLAFAALCANGCGTIWNLSRGADMHPYGGIRKDCALADHEKTTRHEGQRYSLGTELLSLVLLGPGLIIGATEFCLTLVGDTLTLPLTSYVEELQSRKAAADHVGNGIVTPPTTADTSSSPSDSSENSQAGDATRLPDSPGPVTPATFGRVQPLSEGS